MKQLCIAAALLAALFAGALWNASQITRTADRLTDLLEQAEQSAAAGDWDTAEVLTRQAMTDWHRQESYFSLVLCHADTDEVTTAFQEVMGFLTHRSLPEYASASASLVEKVEHLSEMERVSWGNLL